MSHATPTDVRSIVTRTGIAAALVVVGVIVGYLLAVGASIGVVLGTGEIGESEILVVSLVATQIGFLLAALGFLWRRADHSFVACRRPTLGEVRVGAVALVAALGAQAALQLLETFTGLEPASTLSISDGVGTTWLLAIAALTVFAAPPVEELLFRGIVQRYVRDVSSTTVGIAVATLLFVPVHGFMIVATATSVAGTIATILVLVVVSIALGGAYARTDNLAVPICVHMGYNAFSAVAMVVSVL